jgi:hypothetical protein
VEGIELLEAPQEIRDLPDFEITLARLDAGYLPLPQ